MPLPLSLFLVLLPAVLALALLAPLHALLVLDQLLVLFPGRWSLPGGILADPTDLIFSGVVLAILLRGKVSASARGRQLPHLRLWLALGLLLCLAYLYAPINRQYLTDPLRIGYQLLRYCWKPILYFPLAFLLLDHRRKAEAVLTAVIAGADLCAVQAIIQGYQGIRAGGPFGTGNELAGVLVGPSILALSRLLFPSSRWMLAFSGVSLLLLGRALLFSGSRGGMAAVLAGSLFFAGGLFTVAGSRQRLIRLAPVGLVLGLSLFVVKPDLLERPTVQRALSLTQGTEASTMQWRMQERWPHFWRLILNQPWLGMGMEVDPSLEGHTGKTPHNGYLSLAVRSGLPALFLFLAFVFYTLRNSLVSFRRAQDAWLRLLGLTIASVLVGVLTHNVVESTFTHPVVGNLFWLLCALASRAAYWRREVAPETGDATRPEPRARPAILLPSPQNQR